MGPSMVMVGRITSAVGLDGAFRVQSFTDNPQRFARGAVLYLNGASFTVQYSRQSGRGAVIKLHGVDSRERAEALRGGELLVAEKDVPSLPEGTYYHFQLIGLQVVDPSGQAIGMLRDIMETGANDVYVVAAEGRDILVPAVAGFILEVDVPGGRMVVDLPQGL